MTLPHHLVVPLFTLFALTPHSIAQSFYTSPPPLDPYAYIRDDDAVRVEVTNSNRPDHLEWEEYDARGLLVRADFGMTSSRELPPIAIEAVDVEAGLIHLTEPLPLDASYGRFNVRQPSPPPDEGLEFLLDRGSLYNAEPREATILAVTPATGPTAALNEVDRRTLEATEVGDLLHATIHEPVTHHFTYEPNTVHEDRVTDDGRTVERYTHHYGLDGLREVVRHADGSRDITFCAEYDNAGRRTLEREDCDDETNRFAQSFRFAFDEEGRLARVFGDELGEPLEARVTYLRDDAEMLQAKIRHDGALASITSLTYDRAARTIDYTSTDASGRLPGAGMFVELLLHQFGVTFPHWSPYLLDGWNAAHAQLDDEKRVILAELHAEGSQEQARTRRISIEYTPAGEWSSIVIENSHADGDKSPVVYQRQVVEARE